MNHKTNRHESRIITNLFISGKLLIFEYCFTSVKLYLTNLSNSAKMLRYDRVI